MAITLIGHTSANSGSSSGPANLTVNVGDCTQGGTPTAGDIGILLANNVGGSGVTGSDSLSWPSKEQFISANATCRLSALVKAITSGDISANAEVWTPSTGRPIALAMAIVRGGTLDATATTGVTESASVTSIPIHVLTPTHDSEDVYGLITGNVSAANTGATFTAPSGWAFVDQSITLGTFNRVFSLILRKSLGAGTAGTPTSAASVTTGGVAVRALSASVAIQPTVAGAPTANAGPDQINLYPYSTHTLDFTASHSNASGTLSYTPTSAGLTFDTTVPTHPTVKLPGVVDFTDRTVSVLVTDSANGLTSTDVMHLHELPCAISCAVGGVWVPAEVVIS